MKEDTERSLFEGLLYYLSILRKHWKLILITTIVFTALAVAFSIASLRLPPDISPYPDMYTATATLLTQRQLGSDLAASLMSALGIEQRTIDSSTGFDTGALILQVVHSRSLLDRVINEFDLVKRYHIAENIRGNSRLRLLKLLDVQYARSSGTITMAFQDTDPVFARDVVNRMVALLDDWFNQNSDSAKKRQIQMLEDKVTEVKSDINRLENRLKELQKQYGVLNAQDLGASQAASLADLRSQLILKEIEIKNYSSFSIVDDPKLQQLREERQNVLDLIDQIQKSMPGNPQSADSPASIKSLPDVAQEFSQLTLELEIQKRIYNTLSPQYEAAKLTADTESVFQVLELAEIPDLKSGPQRSRLVLLTFALSLVGSILLSFLFHMIEGARKDTTTKTIAKSEP
jgi:capsule polysaccharide export protein KpsE/RkpR